MESARPTGTDRPRRAVLLVRNGPMKGQRAVLAPGATLTIGRSEQASLVIPGDRQMSALHCAVTWSNGVCQLRDLGSIKGTKLGGEPVAEALVDDGNYLQCGDTLVSVYIEGSIPPRKRSLPPPEVRALREKALSALRSIVGGASPGGGARSVGTPSPSGGRARVGTASPGSDEALYAVLDAARDDRILELLPRSGEDFESLYDGVRGEALAEVAPYLVRFSPGSPLLESLVLEGWGLAWGVYLTWAGPMKELRRHLRRFLLVLDDETTQRLYFRYYDPRVLARYWPTCSPLQAAEILGEIGCFLLEGEASEVLRLGPERG